MHLLFLNTHFTRDFTPIQYKNCTQNGTFLESCNGQSFLQNEMYQQFDFKKAFQSASKSCIKPFQDFKSKISDAVDILGYTTFYQGKERR